MPLSTTAMELHGIHLYTIGQVALHRKHYPLGLHTNIQCYSTIWRTCVSFRHSLIKWHYYGILIRLTLNIKCIENIKNTSCSLACTTES